MTANGAALVIGPLRTDEFDAAIALWAEAGLLRPWNDPHADLALAAGRATSDVLAARIGGALVATAMVGHDGHRGWVYYLAVTGRYRGRGIGRAMMNAVEMWCQDRGVPKLQLMIRSDNAAVQAFYGAIAYARSDVIVMAKAL